MRSGTTKWLFITSGTLRDRVRGKGRNSTKRQRRKASFAELSHSWSFMGQSDSLILDVRSWEFCNRGKVSYADRDVRLLGSNRRDRHEARRRKLTQIGRRGSLL